jgi:transcriptional regulator of arginine metabolism
MSLKQQRQHAIGRIIGQHAVASQPQLLELLAKEGITATQATVGVIKVRVPGGQSVYALPELESERIAPFDQLRRVLGEWVGEVAASGNLVVLRTPPGCAHVVGSALDRSGLDGLLGTVAGDDTLLCVAAPTTSGDELAERLRQLAGLQDPPDTGGARQTQPEENDD